MQSVLLRCSPASLASEQQIVFDNEEASSSLENRSCALVKVMEISEIYRILS